MRVSVRGVGIEVDDQGPASGDPLLLIMGLGMQLTGWPDDLVQLLVSRGFRVIRLDNRDAGLSQSFDEHGVPSLMWAMLRFAMHLPLSSPYRVRDMADDAVGVLDALNLPRAHVCGASMGGMIAQHMAAAHPQRVKSLTLMMTTTGARGLPQASLDVRRALIARPKGHGPEAAARHLQEIMELIGSPAYRDDPARVYARVLASVQRSYRPAGTARQLLAIAADGDRTPLLGTLRPPTHVIHGAVDPLVPVAAGRDLGARIPGATLDVIDGMGHDLPKELWPRFAAGIAGAAARA